MIDYGSVCSGIEAATVAVHPLGWKPSWFAEIEAFPSAVLAHHYPHVDNLGDMTLIAREVLAGRVHAPSLLVGGTPCQAFSVAGMRLGLDDKRGQLTIKFVELADAIDHVRAGAGDDECIVWWENVPGVLSDKGNAFGCFLGALVGESDALQPAGGKWTNAGCVYGPARTAAWRVLDAQYLGLAQRRRRVFVVASARAGFDPAEVLFEREGLRRDTPPRRSSPQDTPAGTLRSTDGGSDVDHVRAGHIVGPLTAGCGPNGHGGSGLATDKGAEAGHILAFGGNNQAGAIDVATARNACSSASGRMDFESETFVVHGTQDPDVRVGLAHTLGRNNGMENAVFDPNQITSPDNRSKPTPGLCHTLPARASAPIAFSCKDYGADAGELSPTLRAMGHGDSHANAGGQVAVVAHAIQAGALRTNPSSGPDGAGVQADHAYTLEARAEVQAVQVQSQVRRLTPLECERLQGFPDGYTRIPMRLYKQRKITEQRPADMWEQVEGGWMLMAADGPRYKAIGNSKATTVVRWIAQRIDAQVRRLQHANDNNPATASKKTG